MSDLSLEDKAKATMVLLGLLDGIHEKMELLREGDDPKNPYDHNVEQAQIAVENASMRLQQIMNVISRDLEDADV